MPDIRELRQQRHKMVVDARAIVDKADAEKREMSAEEQAQYDTLVAQAEKLGMKLVTEEKLRDLEREAGARMDDEAAEEEERRRRGGENRGKSPDDRRAAAFQGWLRTGRRGEGLELRDLQADDGPSGGFVTAPQRFVTDLIKFVDDEVMIRRFATKFQLGTAGSLGAPELTADPADADWTTELATGSNDTTMKLGKREMYTHPVAKRIKVSKDLIRKSAINIERLVQERFAYKFGVTEEKAFISGTGARQPLGIMTVSDLGIPSSRDVSTGNSTTAIAADNLINVKYSLKAQYQRTAIWLFHRDAIKQLAKLKDGEGQYLWKVGIADNDPDRLLGRPLYMSEFMPNTFTTGLLVGFFGDLTHYWIADALDMQMQRLDELYAETNQVGFIARKETDGAPVLAEAFARVKLA